MKLFMTGASGFIGGAIAQALAGKHEIIAMSRSETSDRAIAGFAPGRFALNWEPSDRNNWPAVKRLFTTRRTSAPGGDERIFNV